MIRRASARAALATAVLLLASAGAPAREQGAPIESPASWAPARIAPGEVFELHVRLRQPLTPPPGVQQARVWDGWSVGLGRSLDRIAGGAGDVAEYRLRPLRLRPAGGDRYRLLVASLPWMLSGTYDVLLRGPGVDASASGALVLGDDDAGRHLDVALPPGDRGVSATLDGKSLVAVAAAFSGWGAEGEPGRVVRFALLGGGADGSVPDAGEVVLGSLERRDCDVAIDIGAGGSASYVGDPHAISVIWSIGERTAAAGDRVRLCPMKDAGALIRAWGFDGAGRPCEARSRLQDRDLCGSAGCGCAAAVGGRARGLARSLAVLFFRG